MSCLAGSSKPPYAAFIIAGNISTTLWTDKGTSFIYFHDRTCPGLAEIPGALTFYDTALQPALLFLNFLPEGFL